LCIDKIAALCVVEDQDSVRLPRASFVTCANVDPLFSLSIPESDDASSPSAIPPGENA